MNKSVVKDYITTITILEHISDSIFILDASAKIQYANNAALEILKMSIEELKDRNISDFLAGQEDTLEDQDKNKFINLIDDIDRGIFNEVEMSLLNRGIVTPVVVSFGLVKNAQKEIQFIITSIKDISIRKQLEKEIEQKKDMSQSQNMIKSLGDLAVSLVHRLSQPLATIKLQVELTQKKLTNEKYTKKNINENLEQISGLLDNMSDTINSVRNFAFKVDDDSLKLVNLDNCIQNAVNQISYELQEREITIDINSEKNLPMVSAIPINIEQAFVMLMKFFWNKFKSENTIITERQIFFTVSNVEDKWNKILVSDNKELENKKYVHRDINRLTDLNKMISDMKVELSAIKAIIESMGGDVKAKKNKQKNVCFIFRIPADEKTERNQLINLIELLHEDI